ncbi:DedA family protein [candidate division KSB1 bacterium]|nr:DedA family protein [candidate division KSB1 bacterium]
MFSVDQLIASYGYIAVGLGCFFEGETILLAAAFLAHKGYLELRWIIAIAAFGSFAGDVLSYLLGRWKSDFIVQKLGSIRRNIPKAKMFLARHGASAIFLMRFSYGLRATTGVLFGITGMPPFKFIVLAALSCSVWAFLIGMAGYFLGHAAEALMNKLAHYEKIVAVAVLLGGFGLWLAKIALRKKPRD